MSVVLLNFNLAPQPIHQGTTAVTASYNGFVTKVVDNDVNLTISVDPGDENVFIVDDAGAEVNSYSYVQTFPVGRLTNLSKVIQIRILNTPPSIVIVPVTIKATPNGGGISIPGGTTLCYS